MAEAKYKRGTRVEVEWSDAVVTGGWDTIEKKVEESHREQATRSVGYFVHEDGRGITLCQSMAINEEVDRVGDTLFVPSGMIHKVHLLRR